MLFLTVAGSVAATGGASANASTQNEVAAVPNTDYRQIRNAAWSQCVDAPGGVFNVHLKLATCSTFTRTRNWLLVPTGVLNIFFIVNQQTGLCMEVNNGTANPFEPVDEFTCNGQPSELWVREDLRLRHFGTNQCLDTVAGPGSELMQFTCGQEAPVGVQSWIIE
ncbi:ricin-type beta-trefoil lectin domain protein [Rhizocola hellebori]|nr:ricin-type beta-trefoil lectin domain protein [Rhizocola hellebori]